MTITAIAFTVLRAALIRNGVWLVDLDGTPTQFYHRACFVRIAKEH